MARRNPVDQMRKYSGFRTLATICVVFLYAPLVVMAIYSFNKSRSISNWGGFSLDWYVRLIENPAIRNAAVNSIVIALISATLATVVATLVAIGLGRGREYLPAEAALGALVRFPLVVPEIVMAISSLIFFVSIGVPLGFVAIIIAHSVFCIPFAYLPISARLASVEACLDEAAQDLYASRTSMIIEILLPLMTPGIAAGFGLAFIVSLDDFIIANFLTGPGSSTLPVVIYGMAKTGFTPEVNAVTTLLLLLSATLIAGVMTFSSKMGKNRNQNR
jgi:spermidine/putrescine transport system permease protein